MINIHNNKSTFKRSYGFDKFNLKRKKMFKQLRKPKLNFIDGIIKSCSLAMGI